MAGVAYGDSHLADEDMALVKFMYLYPLARQLRDTVGDSGLCRVCVMYFER